MSTLPLSVVVEVVVVVVVVVAGGGGRWCPMLGCMGTSRMMVMSDKANMEFDGKQEPKGQRTLPNSVILQ